MREFGTVPNDTWTAAIERMSDEQIIRALTRLAEKGSPHPPSCPEFVAAARPETGSPRYLGTPMKPETQALLAAPRVHRDFDQLRKALRSGQDTD